MCAVVLVAACADGEDLDSGFAPTMTPSTPMSGSDESSGSTVTPTGDETTMGGEGTGSSSTGMESSSSTDAPTTGPGCAAPLAMCADGCVDVKTDAANCGGCESPCGADEVCVDGDCVGECPADQQQCGGSCVDTQVDAANCGDCEVACAACQVCETGACAASPAPLAIDAISGESMLCINAAAMFSVVAPPGAVSYLWTAPMGAVVSAGQGTNAVTIQFATTAGDVCVTYNDGCADSAPTCVAVALSGTPGQQVFNSAIVESFQVPVCITSLRVTASGAQGGTVEGGRGATIAGTFAVTPGEMLSVVTGRQGDVNTCGTGGGGGGSFVWRPANAAEPMIAAGGGGGGNNNWNNVVCRKGIDAVVAADGTQGNGPTSAPGGVAGNGGSGTAPSGVGAGGAGWKGAGMNSTFNSPSIGGMSAPTFAGGAGSPSFAPGGVGGFGGGGGSVCGAGGGGGYSGGGGGEGQSCRAGGGGGGSYNAGADPMNQAGVRVGNGEVMFVWP